VAVIIGLNWLGFIGVILAAPVLATFQLLGNYALRKLFDQDPWEAFDLEARQIKRRKKSYSVPMKKIRSWVAGHITHPKRHKKAGGREPVCKDKIAQNTIKNGDNE
jgi:hypothetical protein